MSDGEQRKGQIKNFKSWKGKDERRKMIEQKEREK